MLNTRQRIGISFDSRGLSAAQRVRTGPARTLRLPRTDRERFPSVGDTSRLRHALDRQGFEASEVVLEVPSDALIGGSVDVPESTSHDAISAMVRIELARTASVPPPTIEAGYWHVPSRARQRQSGRVLATACRHADAEALIGPFEEAGFEVDAIEPLPGALVRLLAGGLSSDGAVDVIADIGWDRLQLALVLERSIIYTREIAHAGLIEPCSLLARRLEIEPDLPEHLLFDWSVRETGREGRLALIADDTREVLGQAIETIATEVDHSLSYIFHDRPECSPGLVLCTGPGATLSGLTETLSSRLEMAAHIATTGAGDGASFLGALSLVTGRGETR